MASRWWVALGAGLLSLVPASAEDPALKNPKDRYSYALGTDLAKQLQTRSIDVDPDLFHRGLKDGLLGSKALLTEEQVRAAIAELQAELKKRQVIPQKLSAGEEHKVDKR